MEELLEELRENVKERKQIRRQIADFLNEIVAIDPTTFAADDGCCEVTNFRLGTDDTINFDFN